MLILAGVSIAMLTGDNGILTQATKAKEKQADGTVVEATSLLWNEHQVEKNIGANNSDFLDYLENTKGCLDSNGIVNVKKLTGNDLKRGNGTNGTEDVYKLIEDSNKYILQYYDKEGSLVEGNLWSVSKPVTNSNLKTITMY